MEIITPIHTRDPEKDLHMRDQAETATGKREGNLKDNRPGNIQDRHHYPHLVPREAECPPASQAEMIDIHNNTILLQAGIHLAEGSMPECPDYGTDYSSLIDSQQPTSNGVLDRRIDCLENAIKQIAAHMGLFQ